MLGWVITCRVRWEAEELLDRLGKSLAAGAMPGDQITGVILAAICSGG